MGIYNSHTEAEASIKGLQRSGFDMKKLSIVGKRTRAVSALKRGFPMRAVRDGGHDAASSQRVYAAVS